MNIGQYFSTIWTNLAVYTSLASGHPLYLVATPTMGVINDTCICNASSKPELSEALTANRGVEYCFSARLLCRARYMLSLVRLSVRPFVSVCHTGGSVRISGWKLSCKGASITRRSQG